MVVLVLSCSRSVALPLFNHRRPTVAGHQDASVIAIGTAMSSGAGETPLWHPEPVRFGSMMTRSIQSSH
ncbi:hypothetical protein PVK06_017113 [Gossypium arboreum]|uniref:Secreted protein n=1 Tax=Gossypium arboreum TaxID=29729 RepID=A0ABR0Q231_GOSAR|nr:hypothetical protein PVK06_017113 [Gossypium arboreum]